MTERPKYPRTGCVVPFCRRTSTLFPGEWICGEHWRLVDRSLKQFRTKRLKQLGRRAEAAEAKIRAAQEAIDAGLMTEKTWVNAWPAVKAWRRLRKTEALIWRRMKRQAIERAGGLA